ncbi:MAG: DEAD/DEAH box helicase [Lachnospiraceae bacterium]|nr:DEAD/DEAH box helicase [Lachnospiraceae bacterium]
MAFDTEYIRRFATDEEIYKEAERRSKKDTGVVNETRSFWKNEITVQYIEGSNKAKLTVSKDEIIKTECSCDEFDEKGICAHCVLAAIKYRERRSMANSVVYSSPNVRTLINEYGNMALGDAYGEVSENKYSIEPEIKVEGVNMYTEFVIRTDKKYLIKNINAFKESFEHGEYVEYTKDIKLYHTYKSFDEESYKLLQFIISTINEYALLSKRANKISEDMRNQRRILLSPKTFDLLINSVGTDTVNIEINKVEINYEIVRKNPKLNLVIEEISSNGVNMYLRDKIKVINGADNLYIFKDNKMYVCDADYRRYIQPLLGHLVSPIYNESQKITMNSRDMGEFTAGIIPIITEYMSIDTELDLDGFKPPELKSYLYMDVKDNRVVCDTFFEYDSIRYNPYDEANIPKVYHNRPEEYKILSFLKRFFKRDEDILYIDMNDDMMFELIDTGINELMELSTVYVSDALKKASIVKTPNIFIGVSINSGLLELDLDFDEIKDNEIKDILLSYKQKKKYHRLKNGEFIELLDNGISALAELSMGLNLSEKELKNKKIELPLFRTLYVDSVLRESNNVKYKRDKEFKEMVRNIKAVEDGTYELPEELSQVLRPYQKTGYFWLKTISEYGLGGILADDMGLGKTLQIISLLLSEKGRGNSIIITPASLVYNWQNEINKFAPELTSLAISGTASERKELLKTYDKYDVIITSYDLLRRDIQEYQELSFRYEIIDEAQFIKNHGTQSARAVKAIHAQTKYALTGTPIENRLSELWSIFDYLMPGFLYTYQSFKKNFETPVIQYHDTAALNQLKHLIAPFIMRRLKKDVLKDLPPKQENIVYSVLEGEQKKLYKASVAKLIKKIDLQSESEFNSSKMTVLSEITKLRQICCHPSLLYTDYKDKSSKLDTCLQLVEDCVAGGHKMLIFSQFTSMLEVIGERLKEAGISYYYLSGATGKEQRIAMVSEFNADDTPVFLISLKAGGTGLNLTSADIVIHYDPWWNIAAQNQATDRVHRIGQKNKVSVYKLIAKGTIEEKIVNLQEKKKNLADKVISENDESLTRFSKDEIINILQEELS